MSVRESSLDDAQNGTQDILLLDNDGNRRVLWRTDENDMLTAPLLAPDGRRVVVLWTQFSEFGTPPEAVVVDTRTRARRTVAEALGAVWLGPTMLSITPVEGAPEIFAELPGGKWKPVR